MRRVLTIGFAFGLALAPAALSAQRGSVAARRAGPGPVMTPNPAEHVLAQREALGLTAAQVTQLERIRDRVKAQNAPLLEQVAAIRPAGLRHGAGPAAIGARMQGMRRHAAQLAPERRRELRDSVHARMQTRRQQLQSLTAEQRTQLRDSVRARVQARRPGMSILTPEQRTQLRDTARAMIEARRQELQQMTPDQRAALRTQQQERVAAMRAKMEQLKPVLSQVRENVTASRKEVEGVLTSEQLAKLQSLRGRGRGGARPR